MVRRGSTVRVRQRASLDQAVCGFRLGSPISQPLEIEDAIADELAAFSSTRFAGSIRRRP
jgi:hypothetical protein